MFVNVCGAIGIALVNVGAFASLTIAAVGLVMFAPLACHTLRSLASPTHDDTHDDELHAYTFDNDGDVVTVYAHDAHDAFARVV